MGQFSVEICHLVGQFSMKLNSLAGQQHKDGCIATIEDDGGVRWTAPQFAGQADVKPN